MYSDALASLLDGAVSALTAPPTRRVIAPGAFAAFDCAQVWVLTESIEPHYTAPNSCNGGATVVVQVGVLRCVKAMNDNGTPPTARAVTADGSDMNTDARELFEWLRTHPWPSPFERGEVVRWTPLGPEGGLAGGHWTLNLRSV